MELNSFAKIYLFIGVIFLIGYFLTLRVTKKKGEENNKAFFFTLIGMYCGVAGDVAMLQIPVRNYPVIAPLINSSFYVLLFFALPAIGGLAGVVAYSLFSHKNKHLNV